MTYRIVCETTVDGTVSGIWEAWTDMLSYPVWDPREELLTLDGPFAVGTTGFSKQVGGRPGSSFVITVVERDRRWANECPLPGGRLELDHELLPLSEGKVFLRKSYRVHGPLAILFRLYFGREIRRNMPSTFAALEAEAARRDVAADR